MKVAIYARVSTQDQNLDNQLIILREYAKRLGYTDITEFTEKESTRNTRPVQYALFNSLKRREYDALIVYKLDRWARSTKELIDHVETLISKNIKIHSHMEAIDFTSSMGKAMMTIISAFAQLERDIISERTKAGLQRARAQGKILGRPRKNGKKQTTR
jgi:putative DNA-invertase from lambdoid prophage Rac